MAYEYKHLQCHFGVYWDFVGLQPPIQWIKRMKIANTLSFDSIFYLFRHFDLLLLLSFFIFHDVFSFAYDIICVYSIFPVWK